MHPSCLNTRSRGAACWKHDPLVSSHGAPGPPRRRTLPCVPFCCCSESRALNVAKPNLGPEGWHSPPCDWKLIRSGPHHTGGREGCHVATLPSSPPPALPQFPSSSPNSAPAETGAGRPRWTPLSSYSRNSPRARCTRGRREVPDLLSDDLPLDHNRGVFPEEVSQLTTLSLTWSTSFTCMQTGEPRE